MMFDMLNGGFNALRLGVRGWQTKDFADMRLVDG